MSFGVGVADIIQALHFVKVTYDSWKDAPERYQAIKQRLHALRGPLKRLAGYYADSHRRNARSSQRDLDDILFSIENTLELLDRIIVKRSDLKFWDRLRLNSHEINDLSGALDRHVQDLTCLCTSLGLENSRELRHGQEALQIGQHDLKQGQDELLRLVSQLLPPKVPVKTLEAVAQSVDSFGVSSSSCAVDYGAEDDPAMWREFRLKALAEGVTSRDLEAYQEPLHHVLRSLSARRQKGRRPVLLAPAVSFDETVELASRMSRSSRRHDDQSFLFPSFNDLPLRYHGRSQSRARASREVDRPALLHSLRDARSSSLEEDGHIRHASCERSRYRRQRGGSLSIESESRSEITLVIRGQSIARR